MRILLTGGGSGGHIYPLISVAEQLNKLAYQKSIDLELNYIGVPDNYESLLVANGIKVSKIASAKLRRYFDIRNLIDLPKFIYSFFQAFWKIFWMMPDVVFSKGGPGSFPVIFACRFYAIPVIIHESDSVPGLSNLVASKFAKRIGISFTTASLGFADNVKNEKNKQRMLAKIALVGNPVRNIFVNKNENVSKETAKKIFGFDSAKPLILIIGGSQGALRLNDFFISIAEELLFNGFQVLHQTGLNNFELAKKDLDNALKNYSKESQGGYKLVPYFSDNIVDAFRAADIIISRAGSGSIFEIAIMGKPSILIPLPEAAYDHQVKNAFEYSKTGASIVMEEVNLTSNLFFTQLKKIFSTTGLLEQMSASAKSFSKPEAATLIAQEIIKLGSW